MQHKTEKISRIPVSILFLFADAYAAEGLDIPLFAEKEAGLAGFGFVW